jgi:hypothetical protein
VGELAEGNEECGGGYDMSNLVDHAKRELKLIGAFDKDKDFYGGMTGKAVMQLVRLFAKQGHSGMSASLVRSLFDKVARYEPISPLTGEDDEWNEIRSGLLQNKRCSRVFKRDGVAYDSEGIIFREPNGTCYQNINSRVNIIFPYTPHIEYVDVAADDSDDAETGDR